LAQGCIDQDHILSANRTLKDEGMGLLRCLLLDLTSEQQSQDIQQGFIFGMQESEVPNFLEAFGQDMLEVAADKFQRRQCLGGHASGLCFFVSERHMIMLAREDVGIGDRYTIEIGRKIGQCSVAIANGFQMDDPLLLPGFRGNVSQQSCFAERVFALCFTDPGEWFNPHKEALFGESNFLMVLCNGDPWNEKVYMGMKCPWPRPRVQHPNHADISAAKTCIPGQFFQAISGGLEQDIITYSGILLKKWFELLRNSHGGQEIFGGQEVIGLVTQPCLGLFMLALRTGAVLTGVVTVVELLAMCTEPSMAAEMARSARQDIAHGFCLLGCHARAVLGQVFGAMTLEYLCESGHRSAIT